MPKEYTASGIQMLENPRFTAENTPEFLSEQATGPVRRWQASAPGYAPTPLVGLSGLAQTLGVRAVLVKDESKRFGLNAFKGLGGLYALCRVVCEHLGLDYRTATLAQLQQKSLQPQISQMVFITTTDGNHGKGVSWAAGMLGCKAHVYMPKGSAPVRAQAIRDAGSAEVTITDMNYDDTVRYTAALAKEKGWFLVQDTSWPGYEQVPRWIVQGYTTMVYEALRQMGQQGFAAPTHVFLQAGVGAMAGGVLGALVCSCGKALPCVSIVEPCEVACIYASAQKADGAPHAACGSGETMMAGLNCAEPCGITWPILRDMARFYFACPDSVSAHGMRVLADPAPGDAPLISGESGAVGAGLLSLLCTNAELQPMRSALGLGPDSVVLLLNTEGDTDPQNYQKIVGHGAHSGG